MNGVRYVFNLTDRLYLEEMCPYRVWWTGDMNGAQKFTLEQARQAAKELTAQGYIVAVASKKNGGGEID